MSTGYTDQAVLTTDAYATGDKLAARQAIYRWQTPRHDIPALVLNELAAVRGTVLDVGCGNGAYLRRLRAQRPDLTTLGMDLSAGMLSGLGPRVLVGDASRLPIADDLVDAVLALHMLYHVPDIPAALNEFRRVLRPGGLAVVTTNAADDKAELPALWALAAADVTGQPRESSMRLAARFAVTDAQRGLAEHIGKISTHELVANIDVPDPEPVLAYLASTRTFSDPDVPFDAVMDRAGQLVSAEIAERGAFRIVSRSAIVVARTQG